LFIPIVVGGIVIARPALIFVFSGTYASAAVPLTLLLVAMLMTVISDNLRRVLHAQHRQVTDLRLVTAAAIVALALNLGAIALWGAMGAGVAALASEALLLALVLRQLAAISVTGLVLRGLARPLIAAAIMAACIAPFSQQHLFLAVVSGAFIYAAAIFLLGVRIPADLHAIEPAPGEEPITEEVS
jgi:O-antigen/teichoic acid export membrane protein